MKTTQRQVFYESDHFSTNDLCNEIILTVQFWDNYDTQILDIFDKTANVERKLSDFPENEQRSMKARIASWAEYVTFPDDEIEYVAE